MKKLLAAGLAAGALALNAPVVARASGDNYNGGCGFETLNDTTPGGQLGGQQQWTGDVYAAVVATDPPGGTISVDCVLRIDGGGDTVVLSAGAHAGASGATGRISFSAPDTAVVELCDRVTIDGVAQAEDCGVATVTPLVPPVVTELLDTVITCAGPCFVDVFSKIDPTLCPVFAQLAPGLGPVIVNSEGDVWIGSTAPEDKFWDCPPYDPPAV